MSDRDFIDEVIQPDHAPRWIVRAVVARPSKINGAWCETKYFSGEAICWFATRGAAQIFRKYPSDILPELLAHPKMYLGDNAEFASITICGVAPNRSIITETVAYENKSLIASLGTAKDHTGGPRSKQKTIEDTTGRPNFLAELPHTDYASKFYMREVAR